MIRVPVKFPTGPPVPGPTGLVRKRCPLGTTPPPVLIPLSTEFLNARFPIVLSPVPKVNNSNELHFSNALFPILVTLLGIASVPVNELQL